MNKKLIPILLIAVVIGAGAWGYLYYTNNNKQDTPGNQQTGDNQQAIEDAKHNLVRFLLDGTIMTINGNTYELQLSNKKIITFTVSDKTEVVESKNTNGEYIPVSEGLAAVKVGGHVFIYAASNPSAESNTLVNKIEVVR